MADDDSLAIAIFQDAWAPGRYSALFFIIADAMPRAALSAHIKKNTATYENARNGCCRSVDDTVATTAPYIQRPAYIKNAAAIGCYSNVS